jgi:hypothetical protein
MEPHWLARPATIHRLWLAFLVMLVATIGAELFVARDAYFGIDTLGFNAWYGFASCAALIGVAKLLGLVLKRPDVYYEERE